MGALMVNAVFTVANFYQEPIQWTVAAGMRARFEYFCLPSC